MARYHELYASVEALQYDGTRDSAQALASAFPGRIARDLVREDVVLALVSSLGREELREVPIGSWLVRRLLESRLELVSDDLFAPYHKRMTS